jgi:hypothetical protein
VVLTYMPQPHHENRYHKPKDTARRVPTPFKHPSRRSTP